MSTSNLSTGSSDAFEKPFSRFAARLPARKDAKVPLARAIVVVLGALDAKRTVI
jgi:hypothetical protein